jgi:TRAP-type transport system periplasmic protein
MKKRVPVTLLLGVLLVITVLTSLCLSACSANTPSATSSSAAVQTTSSAAQTTSTAMQTAASSVQAVELKIVTEGPPTHFIYALMQKWADNIQKQTNGRVHFTLYPAGTLCNPPEIFDAVLGGIADIAIGPPGYAPARFALNGFTGDSLHRLPSSVVGSKIYTEIWQNSPQLQAEFDGMKLIWLAVHGPAAIHTKFPCNTLEDLKGKEIRYPGSLSPFAKALGIVPISMPMSEAYVNLEKGIVKGVTAPMVELKANRFAEVTEYSIDLKYYAGARCTIMNLKKWDSLPQDVKLVIDGLSKWAGEEEAKGWDSNDLDGVEFAKTLGHKFVTPTPETLKQMYDILYAANDTQAAKLEGDGKAAKALLQVEYQVEEKYLGPR